MRSILLPNEQKPIPSPNPKPALKLTPKTSLETRRKKEGRITDYSSMTGKRKYT